MPSDPGTTNAVMNMSANRKANLQAIVAWCGGVICGAGLWQSYWDGFFGKPVWHCLSTLFVGGLLTSVTIVSRMKPSLASAYK